MTDRAQLCRDFAADSLKNARRARAEALQDHDMFDKNDPSYGIGRVMYHMKQYAYWKARATGLEKWQDGYDEGFDRGWGGMTP